MKPTTDIPTTISDEAAEHVAELGLQDVFEKVLTRARETIPALLSLNVRYQPGYDIDIPCVLIEAMTRDFWAAHEAEKALGLWRLTEIPPEQGQHFVVLAVAEPPDAG